MKKASVTQTKSRKKAKVKKWLAVVAGVMKKGPYVLVGKRKEGYLKDFWEFPGGKIELGETPVEALRRELREELGIEVLETGMLLGVETYYYESVGIVIVFYEVKCWQGEPKCHQHFELKWVLPKDLIQFENIPSANRQIVFKLLENAS